MKLNQLFSEADERLRGLQRRVTAGDQDAIVAYSQQIARAGGFSDRDGTIKLGLDLIFKLIGIEQGEYKVDTPEMISLEGDVSRSKFGNVDQKISEESDEILDSKLKQSFRFVKRYEHTDVLEWYIQIKNFESVGEEDSSSSAYYRVDFGMDPYEGAWVWAGAIPDDVRLFLTGDDIDEMTYIYHRVRLGLF